MKRILFILTISLALFLTTKLTFAQELPKFQSFVILSAFPSVPSPEKNVVVRANLFNIDGKGATFNWALNGAFDRNASGSNKNAFQFKASTPGTIYTVRVNVILADNTVLSNSIGFTVSDLDFTWQAKTQAPPSFQGKLLATPNSNVIISANPQLFSQGTKSLVSPKTLNYKWFRDGILDQAQSGIGRPNFNIMVKKNPGEKETVRLEVSKDERTLTGNLTIPVYEPELIVTARNKGDDLYFASTKQITPRISDKVKFTALPYFFATPVSQMRFQWFNQNTEISNPDNSADLDLKLKPDTALPFSTIIKAVVSFGRQFIEKSIKINVSQ